MSVQIGLNGNIVCTDSDTNSISFSENVAINSVAGTIFANANALTISTSPVAIALPVSPAQFVYIKNTHATNTVLVTWTPNGGASNIVITLEPGSYIIFGEAAAGGGITALSVTGSATNTTLRYIIGG